MFYDLANSKGIKTGPTRQVIPPFPTTTAYAPTIAIISAIETSVATTGVDKLVNVTTSLSAMDPPISPISTNNGRDEDQPFILKDNSSK